MTGQARRVVPTFGQLRFDRRVGPPTGPQVTDDPATPPFGIRDPERADRRHQQGVRPPVRLCAVDARSGNRAGSTPNNVDIEYGLALGGEKIDIAGY